MGKNKPLVSVVMSVFNGDRFLSRAIESILNQTLKEFEFIIINDASKDKTLSIIKQYSKKDRRIRLINNKKNMQIARSLNRGVALSKSDFIARMDSDDIAHPQRLEQEYDFLIKNKKTAIVGTNILIIDEYENIISKREYPTTPAGLKKIMLRYSPFAHPTVMFRKKVFEEFGGYDTRSIPCEDIDFWFKVASKYPLGNIAKHLLKYTLSTISTSHCNLQNTELVGFKLKINAVRKYNFRPSVYDILYNIMQFSTIWLMSPKIRIKFYNLLRSKKFI